MTEAEWLASHDSLQMLRHLEQVGPDAERKYRLLACACCRAVWDFFTDERSRAAVEVVERFADGVATAGEVSRADEQASIARDMAFGPESTAPLRHRSRPGKSTSWVAYAMTNIPPAEMTLRVVQGDTADALESLQEVRRGQAPKIRRDQAVLLRDIFGNPFRPVAFDPRWRTETAVSLAQGIYADRAFDRLPILADALQDAGCEDADVLAHCRGDGPHVRGCWVVDRVLGKD